MDLAPAPLEAAVDIGFGDVPFVGKILELPTEECRALNFGLADVQLARVTDLGHRDKFARPYDWENLLSLVGSDEELLWIVGKEGDAFTCYLGLKANRVVVERRETVRERRRQFATIANHFCRRSFPESRLHEYSSEEVSKVFQNIGQAAKLHMVSVSGAPSPKDLEEDATFEERHEERRPQASLNDVLEPFLEEQPFWLVFSLARTDQAELNRRLGLIHAIRDWIHPEKRQEGNKTASEGTGGHEDLSRALSRSVSQQEQRWLLPKIVQFIAGTKATSADGQPTPESRWQKFGGWEAGTNYQISKSHTGSRGTNWSRQTGETINFSRINSALETIDRQLELSVRHLEQGLGTGGFFGHVAIYATDPYVGERIGHALAGALSGSQSRVRPFQVIPCTEKHADFALRTTLPVHRALRGVALLNSHQAGRLFITPEAELPGLRLKRNVFYGRPPAVLLGDAGQPPAVEIGDSAFFKGGFTPMVTGRRRGRAQEQGAKFTIPTDDLTSHLLITGTTGSGKTTRAVRILNGLHPPEDFRILVIETAKKTYRERLRRGGVPPEVYTLGNSQENPFRINPFYFDPGTSLKRHISVLSNALCDLLPVEAMVGPKLHEAIVRAYYEAGWNVERGEFEGGTPVFPTMIDFNAQVTALSERLKYSSEMNQNYTGALASRARVFVDDVYQDIFAFDGNRPFDTLFARDAVLEMDELPPSEINLPAFLVSLLLERLRAFRNARRHELRYQHLVVIEEAHNILHRRLDMSERADEAGGGGRLLKQVVRLLQEGRELGIGVVVVDQSAQNLADAVLKNTNTKIIHRLEDGEETRVVGTAIGLGEEDWPDLQKLADHECIVKAKQSARPVKLAFSTFRETLPGGESAVLERRAAPAPDYTAGQKLIERVHRQAGNVAAVAAAGRKLLDEVCGGRVDLANFLVGKYRVWNDLIRAEDPWVAAGDETGLAVNLGRLAGGRITPAAEFDDLLRGELAGDVSDEAGWRLAGGLFGPRWLSRASAAFLRDFWTCAGVRGPSLSGEERPEAWFVRSLQAWVREVEAGGPAVAEGENVRMAVSRLASVRAAAFPALIVRHWQRLPPPVGSEAEIGLLAAAGDWSEVWQRLEPCLPPLTDPRLRKEFAVYAFTLVRSQAAGLSSDARQLGEFAGFLAAATDPSNDR